MDAGISRIIDDGLITPVYQPLVDLQSSEVVGYEALARGPEGELHRPDRLFDAARAAGRLADLDLTARRRAIEGAEAAGLGGCSTLFVNVEPEAIGLQDETTPVPDGLRVVAEITERALTARPADLLHMVEGVRERGIGVAVDDVGADRRSLALLPFLRPDVVKLDLRLIQGAPSAEVAEVNNAVSAHAERTGAIVVAEGIETEAHLERALTLGASVGQGWLFGRPAPLPAAPAEPARGIPIFEKAYGLTDRTPFRLIEGSVSQREGTKRLLLEISRELERQAQTMNEAAVLISTFQHARHFTSRQASLYGELAESLAFVGALGTDMPAEPAPGVRGSNLDADDPLVNEWDIVVIGPHFAAAFTAHDLGGESARDMDRRFAFQLTYDRDRAVAAARHLMARIAPVATAGLPLVAAA